MIKTIVWTLGIAVAAATLTSCTEITENYSSECTPKTLRCEKGHISICKDDGTGFTAFKTCKEESECEVNDKGIPSCEGEGAGGGSCVEDADCTDNLGALSSCQVAVCGDGGCQVANRNNGAECDDGSLCTENDLCTEGVCMGSNIDCDDENDCTKDECNAATGCTSTPDETLQCDDGKPCTVDDKCTVTENSGQCEGKLLDCDDGNDCTEDFCDQVTGECKHTPSSGDCDDGDSCTNNDKCQSGVCSGVASKPCTGDEDCTGVNGCGNADPCKGVYYCANDGFCRTDKDTAFKCPQEGMGPCEFSKCINNDGKPECKTLQEPDETACTDGSECTVNDQCVNGACVGTLDPSIPGCAFFRLKSWLFTAAQIVTNENYKLRATVGNPVFGLKNNGVSSNDKYKLKSWATGL